MASTYEKIATTTLGSASASVTFSSISGAYTDLVIICAPTLSSSSTNLRMRFNSDSNSNYSVTLIYGTGSVTGSELKYPITAGYISDAASVSASSSNFIVNLMNYSNSTTYKTWLSRGNTTGNLEAIVGLWRNTAAITSIEIFVSTSTFASGSTFTLYGILKA